MPLPAVHLYMPALPLPTAPLPTPAHAPACLQYASQPVEVLSMAQMMQFGRYAATQPEKILKSARFVQREVGATTAHNC